MGNSMLALAAVSGCTLSVPTIDDDWLSFASFFDEALQMRSLMQ